MATARDDLQEVTGRAPRRRGPPPGQRGQAALDLEQLGKQAGLFGLGFAPGAGVADYFGQFPSAEGGTEPSAVENWQAGNYGTAAMQGLGAMGDMMYAVPLLGATVGSAMKGPRTAQRMLKELPDFFKTVNPGDNVSGLVVREDVPNMSSISASMDQYTVLPGIKEVPKTAFDASYISGLKASKLDKRTESLSKEIEANKEINPLIVAVDNDGAYIIEGGHRFDALMYKDTPSVPAVVVIDETNPPSPETLARMQAPRAADQGLPAVAPPVETKEFKNWFGDSKVTNEDGAPITVYHGTVVRPDTERVKNMGDIAAFDRMFSTKFRRPSVDTLGSWFSTNPGAGGAEMYSGNYPGSAVYPAYLSIKNPEITTFEGMTSRARKLVNGKDDDRMIGQEEVDAYRDWLRSRGKDGIKIESSGTPGVTEFDLQDAWIALEPSQIKSAFNRGTYDPKDPRILYGAGAGLGAAGIMGLTAGEAEAASD